MLPEFAANCICTATQRLTTLGVPIDGARYLRVKIAKPILLVSTPIGVAGGLYEAYRLAGGLAFVMLALVAVIAAAVAMVVATVRRESAAAAAVRRQSAEHSALQPTPAQAAALSTTSTATAATAERNPP